MRAHVVAVIVCLLLVPVLAFAVGKSRPQGPERGGLRPSPGQTHRGQQTAPSYAA